MKKFLTVVQALPANFLTASKPFLTPSVTVFTIGAFLRTLNFLSAQALVFLNAGITVFLTNGIFAILPRNTNAKAAAAIVAPHAIKPPLPSFSVFSGS